MSKSDRIVIVGASLAGAKAAATLRAEGFTGGLTLIGTELHHPYERPPLSKEVLQGKAEVDSVYLNPIEWYADNDVDLRLGTTVTAIDRRARSVTLDDGSTLEYHRLLLATGASPRPLALPGSELDGVHYLRTIDDAERLHAALESGGKRVVVIGGGWIGLETAASARQLGNDVIVLDRGEFPLVRAIGPDLGRMFTELHADHGVEIRPMVAVSEIVGSDGHVSSVTVYNGDAVPADLVIAGIGVTPNIDLALNFGIDTTDDGIRVDGGLRSNDPAIFAAGDIACVLHPGIHKRLHSAHWQNAISTGEAAARSMLGQKVSYDEIPYFFTDQYDLGMEFSGYAPLMDGAELVYRGNRDTREFIAFWLTPEHVPVAGMNVNVWDVNGQVQRLIRQGTPVDPAQLEDPAVPLDTL